MARPESIALSLHQLSLLEVSHERLVDIAAEVGCRHACFFLKVPHDGGPLDRVNSIAQARALRRRMEGAGLSACNGDTAMLSPGGSATAYEEFFAIAEALGCRTFTVLGFDPDMLAAADMLAALTERGHAFGLTPIVECFRFSEVRTLADATGLIASAGGGAALNVDVLHLMRNGGRPADLAAIDPAMRFYAQIADGPREQPLDRQMEEAGFSRMIPGSGEFPLVEFIRQLPDDAVLSVEAPVAALKSLPPLEQARRIVQATRDLIGEALGEGDARLVQTEFQSLTSIRPRLNAPGNVRSGREPLMTNEKAVRRAPGRRSARCGK
jgi:sugar phosphate isomerase/epimerase